MSAGVERWQAGIEGQMGGGARREWEDEWRDGRTKTQGGWREGGGHVWRWGTEDGESGGGITNRQVRWNGWGLIAAEMESTLQVLTECSTSGAGPRKEQIIAVAWSGASVSLQQTREMCRGVLGGWGWEWDWRGRGVLQRETGLLSIFRVVRNVSQKVSMRPAAHFITQCLRRGQEVQNGRVVIIRAAPLKLWWLLSEK